MKQSGTELGTALNIVSNQIQIKFAQDRIECAFCEAFISGQLEVNTTKTKIEGKDKRQLKALSARHY